MALANAIVTEFPRLRGTGSYGYVSVVNMNAYDKILKRLVFNKIIKLKFSKFIN